MRKRSYTYFVLALAAAALVGAPSTAQPVPAPFSVHRANSASLVQGGPLLAQTAQAPFDDAPGSLSDGAPYFYLVTNAAGAVPLSVQKNLVLDAVRLGFDDGDPASAAVDALRSSVTLNATSIPADGATLAIVVVIPVDLQGVPLGSGLAVTIDASALLPGIVASPVVDLGDGSYSFVVLSLLPGTGAIVVDVEGTTLASRPAVTFELVGPSVCGDGFVDTANQEACDDGNASDADACPSTCQPAVCGDGFVWSGVEQCDGGISCNPNCTSSTCGVNGNLEGCTTPNALLVLIGQFQALIAGAPGSPLAAELQVIVGHLQVAHAALTQATPDRALARARVDLALGHLDDAVAKGLNSGYAWTKGVQLFWIRLRI